MNVTACLRGERCLIYLIVPKRGERERAEPLEHAPYSNASHRQTRSAIAPRAHEPFDATVK